MTDRIRLEVSGPERVAIVAALKMYCPADPLYTILAQRIAQTPPYDAAEDGPEVEIIEDLYAWYARTYGATAKGKILGQGYGFGATE